jgi:hypothetical protein
MVHWSHLGLGHSWLGPGPQALPEIQSSSGAFPISTSIINTSLHYSILVGTRDLRELWSPPISLNLVHVLVFFSRKTFILFIFYFYVFSVFIIILYNKNKSVSFSLLYFFLFECKFEVWRKKTHLILFQVGFFFIIISFIFSYILLFIWFLHFCKFFFF